MKTEIVSKKLIVWSVGSQFGGVGKSTSCVLVADYLRSIGRKIAVIDSDTGKWGKPSSFEHFFGGKATRLDLRRPQDLDRILELTAETEADAVVCDAPANSGSNLDQWWNEVATKDVIDSIGVQLVVLGAVAPLPGSTESVLESISAIGERASYLIALNRLSYEVSPRDTKEAFQDWFSVEAPGFNIKTFEIPHLQTFAMTEFVKAGCLPSKLNGQVKFLVGRRIAIWTQKVHDQLAATGLF